MFCIYDDWDRARLSEHIAGHRELREYEQFWINAKRDYSDMLERRRQLKDVDVSSLKEIEKSKVRYELQESITLSSVLVPV